MLLLSPPPYRAARRRHRAFLLSTPRPPLRAPQACYRYRKWEQCASVAKPRALRDPPIAALAAKHTNVKYMDLYGLFVDPWTGRRSMNVPGTDLNWCGDENFAPKREHMTQDAIGLDGFSIHMNMVGTLYLWPFLCDTFSRIWGL